MFPGGFIGAFADGKLVGIVVATHDGRKGWINRLAVHPDYRRRGIAKKLIEEAEEYLRLVKAINRHRRLIGVILDSAAEEYKQSVRNLILSQKRLIETMKQRAEELEELVKKGKDKE